MKAPDAGENPAPTKLDYRPDIDGLRALSIILLVAYLAFPAVFASAFVGIDVFFVISGFLITSIILRDLRGSKFSVWAFYDRRARRILPALTAVLAACLCVGFLILVTDELKQLNAHISDASGFMSNFSLWGEAGYFDTSVWTKPLANMWSIGVEEQFYLIWPVVLMLAWRWRLNLLAVIIGLAVVSFGCDIYLMYTDPVAAFYAPHARFWELLAGAVLAWCALNLKGDVSDKLGGTKGFFCNVLSVAGLLLILVSAVLTPWELYPGWVALAPVAGTVAVIVAGENAVPNKWLLSNRVMVHIGLISYPLFLWTPPVFAFARIYEGSDVSAGMKAALIAVSVVLSWLSVVFVERPFRSNRGNITVKTYALYGALTIVGCLAWYLSTCEFRGFTFETATVKRKGTEDAVGNSLKWFRGKDDWLFLGNEFGRIVSKLKMTVTPAPGDVRERVSVFAGPAAVAARYNVPLAVIVAPEKSSVYPEYLPDSLVPAQTRYCSVFLGKLRAVPNVAVFDPLRPLLDAKSAHGLLYPRTGSEWNARGAFVAYEAFAARFSLPVPDVAFEAAGAKAGHLVALSGIADFPVRGGDDWNVIWKNRPELTEEKIREKTEYGADVLVTNPKAPSDKTVWVVDETAQDAIKPYFTASFRTVRYMAGYSLLSVTALPAALENEKKRPDLIVIVTPERSF